MSVRCPSCQYARQMTDHAPDWQCPRCGKAYNKAGAGAHTPTAGVARAAPDETDAGDTDADRRGPPIRESLIICALVAAARAMYRGMGIETTLMLVPLFFCVMPALALTGRWRTYVTARWRWSLVRVEDHSGPVLTRLFQILCAVFAVVFTVFILAFSKRS
jgi:hypothetical protein